MPPTFIVVLFYIFEFLYQIQSSIVQQTFIKNPYSDLYFIIPFHTGTQLSIPRQDPEDWWRGKENHFQGLTLIFLANYPKSLS